MTWTEAWPVAVTSQPIKLYTSCMTLIPYLIPPNNEVSMEHLRWVWQASRKRLPLQNLASPLSGAYILSSCWDKFSEISHIKWCVYIITSFFLYFNYFVSLLADHRSPGDYVAKFYVRLWSIRSVLRVSRFPVFKIDQNYNSVGLLHHAFKAEFIVPALSLKESACSISRTGTPLMYS